MIYFSWFACFLKELKTAEQQINVLNVKLFSVFLFQLFFSMFHGFIEHLREETGRERRRGGRRAGHRSDSNHRVSAARTQRSRSGSVQPPIEALKSEPDWKWWLVLKLSTSDLNLMWFFMDFGIFPPCWQSVNAAQFIIIIFNKNVFLSWSNRDSLFCSLNVSTFVCLCLIYTEVI